MNVIQGRRSNQTYGGIVRLNIGVFNDRSEVSFILIKWYMLKRAGQRNTSVIRAEKNELTVLSIIPGCYLTLRRGLPSMRFLEKTRLVVG